MNEKEEYYEIYNEEDSRNYEELYEDEFLEDEMILLEKLDESYENVYDVYICPNCGQVMDLETFLNYIGADPKED